MSSRDVYRALWAHKLFIGFATILVAAAAWYMTSRQQPVYQATTLVRIQQPISDQGQSFTAIATGSKLAQTYAGIVPTRTIARRVYSQLDGAVPYHLIADHISASALPDLDLMRIHVRGPDPTAAQRVARAAPAALEAYIRSTGTIKAEITPTELAALPTAPVAPSKKRNAMFAFLLGLVLNSGLVLAFRAVRDPIDRVDDLEKIVGAPVLATIPPLRFARHGVVQPPPREVVRRSGVEAREASSG